MSKKERKRIVIIAKNIYPTNSPRANRATELAKEFGRQGHDVKLYAVLGNYDYTYFEKCYNISVGNIGKFHLIERTSDGNEPIGIFNRLMIKLFDRLLLYPDIEYLFKVKRLVQGLDSYDLLITVAYPHTIHWGTAWGLSSKATKRPRVWVADCGDPFMKNPFKKYPFYFKYFEKYFCKEADYISVPTKESIQGYYREYHNKIKVIPQGFRFLPKPKTIYEKNQIVTFIFAGTLYKEKRDPSTFLSFLSSLTDLNFRFILYTRSNHLLDPFKDELKNKLVVRDYIERDQLIDVMSHADFLVNFENKGAIQSPSKLIDYALAERPILSISSENLNSEQVLQFLNGDYKEAKRVEDIDQFNIENVTEQFLKINEI